WCATSSPTPWRRWSSRRPTSARRPCWSRRRWASSAPAPHPRSRAGATSWPRAAPASRSGRGPSSSPASSWPSPCWRSTSWATGSAISWIPGSLADSEAERTEPMIDLYNAETNQLLGSITEADLQVLVDGLEEESEHDQDYYIDAA